MNLKTFTFTFFLSMLLSFQFVNGQDIKLAGFNYTRLGKSEIKGTPLNQKVQMNEYEVFFNLPKQLKNQKTIIINGFEYHLVTSDSQNDVSYEFNRQNLHYIGYSLMAIHKLKNQWSLMALFNPTISSMLNTKLDGSDFIINGVLQFVKVKPEKFTWGIGITHTSRFGQPLFVPSIQMSYKFQNSKFQMFLPRSITYERYFGKVTGGVQLSLNGSLYNANYNTINAMNVVEPIDMFSLTRVILGPYINIQPKGPILLELSAGLAVNRQIEFRSDVFEDAKFDIANSPFIQLGISVVPPKDKLLIR